MFRNFLLVAFLGFFCMAAAKKSSQATILIFHETNTTEGKFAQPVTLLNPKKEIHVSTMPLLTERDIVAFYPFDASDGTSGAYFQLGPHGANLLEQFTMGSRDSYLVAIINGRHVIDLLVNARVSDGILSIPHGLLPSDIVSFGESFNVMGQPANEALKRTKYLKRVLAGEFEKDDDDQSEPAEKPTPRQARTPKPFKQPK